MAEAHDDIITLPVQRIDLSKTGLDAGNIAREVIRTRMEGYFSGSLLKSPVSLSMPGQGVQYLFQAGSLRTFVQCELRKLISDQPFDPWDDVTVEKEDVGDMRDLVGRSCAKSAKSV